MSELFSDSRLFSAVAVLQLSGDQPNQGIPLGLAMLDGRMHWNQDSTTGSPRPSLNLLQLLGVG